MYFHLTDAHCHADFSEFADFYGLAMGLDLCVSACFSGDWRGLKNFNAFAVKKAYALHPDLRISEFDNLDFIEDGVFKRFLPNLEEYLISADAIGETGLDANIEKRVPMPLQRKIFEEHLRLAEKYRLPVIIHCVGAWGEVLSILKNWVGKSCDADSPNLKKFLLHAAKCSPEMVKEFEKIGGYFSFGLRELESPKGEKCAQIVSDNRIMIESDSKTSIALMSQTLQKLALVRSINDFELSEITYNNFKYFYKK